MGVTWRESLRELIQGMDREFMLAEVYQAAAPIAAAHPENKSVEATIRRELQNIRDEGTIRFLGNGRYQRSVIGRPTLEQARVTKPAAERKPEPGAPDAVPLEDLAAATYVVSRQQSSEAVRRERVLVKNFEEYLAVHNREFARYRVPTISNGLLFTDVVDVTRAILYEAKGSSSRESIRMAIGQLFDYGRYLEGRIAGSAVLLPEKPNDDMIELLLSLGVGCTYYEGGTFVEAAEVDRAA